MTAPLIGFGLALPLLTASTIQSDGTDFDGHDLAPLKVVEIGGTPSLRIGALAGGAEPFVDLGYRRQASTADADDFALRRAAFGAGYRHHFAPADGVTVGPALRLGYAGSKGGSEVHTIDVAYEASSKAWEASASAGGHVSYWPAPWLSVDASAALGIAYGRASGDMRETVDPLAWVETNEPYAYMAKGWSVGVGLTFWLAVAPAAE